MCHGLEENTSGLQTHLDSGTGLLFLLRWFWWRINAFSEISDMVIFFVAAAVLTGAAVVCTVVVVRIWNRFQAT